MTETCTYLRLKVRRSSLALSRSPTENVALPRKVLCRPRQKKTEVVNNGQSRSLHLPVMHIIQFLSIHYLNYRRDPSNFIFMKRVITEERWHTSTIDSAFPSLFYPLSPLSHSSDNMCLLQAWCEQGVSVHKNWVMESEVGDELINNEERWSTFVENTHTRSLTGMSRCRHIHTHTSRKVLHLQITPSTCLFLLQERPCQGHGPLHTKLKQVINRY